MPKAKAAKNLAIDPFSHLLGKKIKKADVTPLRKDGDGPGLVRIEFADKSVVTFVTSRFNLDDPNEEWGHRSWVAGPYRPGF